MAYRLCGTLVLVAIGFALGAVWDAFGESQQRRLQHPGQVIHHITRVPLSASVKAWAESTRTGMDGSCPVYGSAPIDSATSASDNGRFILSIEQGKRTFTVTYCLSGYVPRVDSMPNGSDRSAVIPTPAHLWPVGPEAANFDDEIRRSLIASINDLAYFHTIDAKRFDGAIEVLASDFATSSEGRAEIIRTIPKLIQTWDEK